jgi:hypothetical protein
MAILVYFPPHMSLEIAEQQPNITGPHMTTRRESRAHHRAVTYFRPERTQHGLNASTDEFTINGLFVMGILIIQPRNGCGKECSQCVIKHDTHEQDETGKTIPQEQPNYPRETVDRKGDRRRVLNEIDNGQKIPSVQFKKTLPCPVQLVTI